MLDIIAWILFGALVGWIASIIMRTNEQMGAFANIAVGILGAFIGGAIYRWLGGSTEDGFSLVGLIVAVLGAMLLIFVMKMFTGRGNHAVRT